VLWAVSAVVAPLTASVEVGDVAGAVTRLHAFCHGNRCCPVYVPVRGGFLERAEDRQTLADESGQDLVYPLGAVEDGEVRVG
jgi:hypothetical protein